MAAQQVLIQDVHVTDCGPTQVEVLRAFDQLRRRLAVRAAGREGAAAGFVNLTWEAMPQEPGRISALAEAMLSTPQWQRVQYRAVFHPDRGEPRLLAHGVGQTVALGSKALAARLKP